MIDVKPLRYFVALAETLHFGRAASRLHISQPPLSRQLSSLEESLGVVLLERSPQQVKLTAAGERFYIDAKAILAALEQAKKAAQATAAGLAGSLSVGFTMCAAYSVVPSYIRTFRKAYPEVRLNLKEVVSHDLAEEIIEGRVDAAIMFPVAPTRELVMRTIFSEPLCVALPRNHPKAGTGPMKVNQLAGEPFILPITEAAPSLRNAIIAHCREGGFEPDVQIEVQLQQTILGLVNEGVGVALVPSSMQKAQLADVAFRKLSGAPSIEQVLAWSPHSRNPCLARFLELVG